jgi:hypothetical protein
MKTAKTWIYSLAGSLVIHAIAASGADTQVVANAPAIDDVDGGVAYVAGADGMITVTFPEQSTASFPTYVAATVVADCSGTGSVFKGDYEAAGVKSLMFNIRSETAAVKPAGAMVVLQGESGRLWRNEKVIVSAQSGLWITNVISFDRVAGGWVRDGEADPEASWSEDFKAVKLIGIRMNQPGFEGLSYSIAEFRLSGETYTTPPAGLTPLQQALYDTFGVTSVDALTEEQKLQDTDGDGMADVVAILSENDHAYAASIFVAELLPPEESGIKVRWPCVAGAVYTVFRSESLTEAFLSLPAATRIETRHTGYTNHLDQTATGAGPYFYKIRRDQ